MTMGFYIKQVLCVFIILLYFDSTAAVYCTEYNYDYYTGIRYTTYMYCSSSCCGSTSNRYCCYYTNLGWTIGAIIGSVIGGIVGLILLCVLIACICSQCNKTTRNGTIVQPHNGTNITMVSSAQQQQSGMYPGPAYPASYPQPFSPQQQPFNQGGPMPPPAYAENVVSSQPPFQTKQ